MLSLIAIVITNVSSVSSGIEFDDIIDLVPGLNADDPVIQGIFKDEVAKIDARVRVQYENAQIQEDKFYDYLADILDQNEACSALTTLAESVKRKWLNIDNQCKALVLDFERKKQEELSSRLHAFKMEFFGELLQTFEGFVGKLTCGIPDSHQDIARIAKETTDILDLFKGDLENSWRRAALATDEGVRTGLASNLQALGSGSPSGSHSASNPGAAPGSSQ